MEIDALYRELAPALFRYVVRLTGDAEMAADVVQETFIRYAQSPPRSTAPKNWLYRVSTNLVREDRRTARRRLQLLWTGKARLPFGDAPPAPDEQVERTQVRDAVRAGLQKLDERDRIVLLMRADGFAYHEIAEAVGTTTQSVGTILIRAMKKLSREFPDAENHR